MGWKHLQAVEDPIRKDKREKQQLHRRLVVEVARLLV